MLSHGNLWFEVAHKGYKWGEDLKRNIQASWESLGHGIVVMWITWITSMFRIHKGPCFVIMVPWAHHCHSKYEVNPPQKIYWNKNTNLLYIHIIVFLIQPVLLGFSLFWPAFCLWQQWWWHMWWLWVRAMHTVLFFGFYLMFIVIMKVLIVNNGKHICLNLKAKHKLTKLKAGCLKSQ